MILEFMVTGLVKHLGFFPPLRVPLRGIKNCQQLGAGGNSGTSALFVSIHLLPHGPSLDCAGLANGLLGQAGLAHGL